MFTVGEVSIRKWRNIVAMMRLLAFHDLWSTILTIQAQVGKYLNLSKLQFKEKFAFLNLTTTFMQFYNENANISSYFVQVKELFAKLRSW